MEQKIYNPIEELALIEECFNKFGVISKELQGWLINVLKHFLGDDKSFVPVIVCGLRQIEKTEKKGEFKSVPAWRGLPVSISADDLPNMLSAISISIAYLNGKNVGINELKPKKKSKKDK